MRQKPQYFKAFTLAEVLVTLAIIGVVASLTIPSLIKNYQETAWKAAWRKEFSLLSQSTKMIEADNGGTMIGAFSSGLSTANSYRAHLKTLKECTVGYADECWHANGITKYLNGESYNLTTGSGGVIGTILKNGNLLYTRYAYPNCDGQSAVYGISICAEIRVDINGNKGPNTFGKDIFGAFVTRTGLKPMGADGDVYSPSTSCIEGSTASSNNGWGCSAKYLYN